VPNNSSYLISGKSVLVKVCAVAMLLLSLVLAGPGTAGAVTPWYAVGDSHTVVLKQDGTVWTMGDNSYGQLGNGEKGGHSAEPARVESLKGVVAIAAGGAYSVALQQDGTVWAWGYNGSGQLGNDSTGQSSIPLRVKGLSNITAIAAGSSHMLALKKDGTVWAWGNNRLGQLGSDSRSLVLTPVRVSALQDVAAIAAGGYHSVALKGDGTVWTFGYNGYGQLGNGVSSPKSSLFPLQVSGLSNIRSVAAGINHTVALGQDHTVWAWGNNDVSQLGNGAISSVATVPTRVNGLSNVTDITAKADHTLALMQDGTVWAWGDNGSGRWGNGISMNGSSTPVQMRGFSSTIAVAAVGNPATLAMQTATGLAGDPVLDIQARMDIAAAGTSEHGRATGRTAVAYVKMDREPRQRP
jgi:alpha-tubulin suppressor-like RCC1 family protein